MIVTKEKGKLAITNYKTIKVFQNSNLPKISLIEAHNISDEVENLLLSQFTNAEIIIHQDPYGLYEKKILQKI